jgi:hypothetical protein
MIDHLADLRMSEVNKHFDVTTVEELRQALASHLASDEQGLFVSAPVAVIQDFMNDQGRRIRAQIASWKDHTGITQINLPTDEQVERAAIAMAVADGFIAEKHVIAGYLGKARWHLAILLNKDRILGYR